jgi:LuxR family transcriptional regulator, maltose regulon positive regulatory protein
MEQMLGTRSPRNTCDTQRSARPVAANADAAASVGSNASGTVVEIDRARQRHNAPGRSVGHLRVVERDGQNPASATVSEPTPHVTGSATGHRGRIVQSLLMEAMARDPVGDSGAAGHALERALDLAEQLAEVLDLLAGDWGHSGLQASRSLREALTESEMRILRLLPTNLSKREIAEELYLSVNTIKAHTRHLYAKLDAHSRREAVPARPRTRPALAFIAHTLRRRPLRCKSPPPGVAA